MRATSVNTSVAEIAEEIVSDEDFHLITKALEEAEQQSTLSRSVCSPSVAVSCYVSRLPCELRHAASPIATSEKENQATHPMQPPLVLTLQPRPQFLPCLLAKLLAISLRPPSSKKKSSPPHPPYAPLHFHPSTLSKIREVCHTHDIPLDFPDSLAAISAALHIRQKESATLEQLVKIIPLSFWEALFPFQRTGVIHAITTLNGRVLIADDMGLGKTLQALAIAEFFRLRHQLNSLSSLQSTARLKPVLVLCPATLRSAWARAIVKWIPAVSLHSVAIVTTPKEFENAMTPPSAPRDVWDSPNVITYIVCSYDLFPRVAIEQQTNNNQFTATESSVNRSTSIVIADECHLLRNIDTVRTRAVMPFILSADVRILVSGTPALSRSTDVYSLLKALLHDDQETPFLSPPLFFQRYGGYITNDGMSNGKFTSPSSRACTFRTHELHALLSAVMIRRSKQDVHVKLPPKHRVRVVASVQHDRLQNISEMFAQVRQLEEECIRRTRDVEVVNCLRKQRENLFAAMYVATADLKLGPVITRVHQLLFEGEMNKDGDLMTHEEDKEKMSNADKETTRKKRRRIRNTKILVFAHHIKILDALDSFLEMKNVRCVRIDGGVPTTRRESIVDEFQSDDDVRVALLSLRVASTGITLTAADTVLFAELLWVPSVLAQAEDRAHRIGRVGPVSVEYLIVPGSLDDAMMTSLHGKAGLVFKMVDGDISSRNISNGGGKNKAELTDKKDYQEFPDEDVVSSCSSLIEISEEDVHNVVSACLVRTSGGSLNESQEKFSTYCSQP